MEFKKILLLLFLGTTCLSFGQNENRIGFFPTIDHSGTISDKLDYSLYYFAAFNMINSKVNGVKEPSNFFVFYSEQALTYNVNPNLSFTGSYVYERQYPTQNNYRNENRFYLQSAYKYNLNKTSIKHRLRYDGRFVQDRMSGTEPFTSRLRYLIGLQTPLQKNSDKLYLSMYNEFFFNLDKNAVAIYGENWVYAGIGYKIDKNNAIEAGPLHIFWVNNKENDLSKFYYLQLTWVNHLDFRKKK